MLHSQATADDNDILFHPCIHYDHSKIHTVAAFHSTIGKTIEQNTETCTNDHKFPSGQLVVRLDELIKCKQICELKRCLGEMKDKSAKFQLFISALAYGGMLVNADYGGGYMASAAGASISKKASNQGSTIPCTCAEILAATQEGDRFISPLGLEFSQVTLLGVVRSVNESATRIEYEIDDYTGPFVPVKMFVEDQACPCTANYCFSRIPYPLDNSLARFVSSRMSAFTAMYEISKVLPVTDMNELTTHIMEVIYTRMLNTKAKLDEASGVNLSKVNSSATNFGGNVANGLTALQNQILTIVRAFVGERGIPVTQLSEKLRGIPERQIRENLDFLSGEGYVYSTVDDDHFRATEP
ncbi:replication protein A [Opisthorchis viverrini]|uniref:Replication protein A n=1 Tax=Opisthorchis viverrini TaxID=6198 RepID=A0A1S8X4J7_OPIVI|nr:replication protein A [Opisthorchis viverrini]